MKAEIITYETNKMSNSKRSIISKAIFGYVDRTKGSQYTYSRKGILGSMPYLAITKKTVVVISADATKVKKVIKNCGAIVKNWKIDIKEKEMKKRYG